MPALYSQAEKRGGGEHCMCVELGQVYMDGGNGWLFSPSNDWIFRNTDSRRNVTSATTDDFPVSFKASQTPALLHKAGLCWYGGHEKSTILDCDQSSPLISLNGVELYTPSRNAVRADIGSAIKTSHSLSCSHPLYFWPLSCIEWLSCLLFFYSSAENSQYWFQGQRSISSCCQLLCCIHQPFI